MLTLKQPHRERLQDYEPRIRSFLAIMKLDMELKLEVTIKMRRK